MRESSRTRRRIGWLVVLGGLALLVVARPQARSLLATRRNWTRGCVALANEHVDALFALADGEHAIGVGTPVAIVWQLTPEAPLS